MYPQFTPNLPWSYPDFTPIYLELASISPQNPQLPQYSPNIPDKGEIVVEAVESGWHEVQAEHLLVLEDAVAQGDDCLVLHVDTAAEHQLDALSDEDDGDCVVRVLAASVPTGRHKHTLDIKHNLDKFW